MASWMRDMAGSSKIDACLCSNLALDIDICQYRCMSKSALLELTPVETLACCSPLTKEPLRAEQAERIAPLLKALAHPVRLRLLAPVARAAAVRLRLLSLVASHADGEACQCDLSDAFELSQPTISHHLKVLHESGLLERTKRGVWAYYRVAPRALADLGALIGGVAG